jgi:uncharacterized protein with NRDE domain
LKQASHAIENPHSEMCLIAFAFDAHPDCALVLAANRDEFYDRPTAPAHFWEKEGEPGLLAGRDERAGGTWMGVTRTGRFAALTNVRAAAEQQGERREEAPSRGGLVKDFLTSDRAPGDFLDALAAEAGRYNGFNLLAGTFGGERPRLAHFSTHDDAPPTPVAPGVHGLSNASLDTAWPKVERSRAALERLLGDRAVTPEALLRLLDDRTPAPAEALPDTGVSPERERALSPVFIQTDGYGTRSSTALLIGRDGAVTFVERSFEEGASPTDRRFSFQIALETAQAVP